MVVYLLQQTPMANQGYQAFDQTTNDSAPYQGLRCKCNLPVKTETVKKVGPNQGRQFYCCPQNQMNSCKFFQFTDEQVKPAYTKKRKTEGGDRGEASPVRPSNFNYAPPVPQVAAPAPSMDRQVALNLLADKLKTMDASHTDRFEEFSKILYDNNCILTELLEWKRSLEPLVSKHLG